MNNQPNLRCFRHQLKPTDSFCALCKAKQDGGGNLEQARKAFVPKMKKSRKQETRFD